MSLLKEIHQQPEPVRHALFLLSVFVAVSMIGSIWISDFQYKIFVGLNSPDEYEERFYAEGKNRYTPAAILSSGVDALRAGIYTVLGLNQKEEVGGGPQKNSVPLLPLSKDKF